MARKVSKSQKNNKKLKHQLFHMNPKEDIEIIDMETVINNKVSLVDDKNNNKRS